jgi:hypothetical protein
VKEKLMNLIDRTKVRLPSIQQQGQNLLNSCSFFQKNKRPAGESKAV